jgi:hypothetical protein
MDSPGTKRKVFITAISLDDNPVLAAGLSLCNKYGLSSFLTVHRAEDADIVLYLESDYLGLRELPEVVKRVRAVPEAMHLMFSEADWVFPILPGAYPSLSRPYPWAHSWCFLHMVDNGDEARQNCGKDPDLLFSFLGSVRTHPVRRQVKALDKSTTPCLDIEDAPGRFPGFHYSRSYIDLIRRSKFILCPRGFGTSSIRIFEAMSHCRAPVVISDHWQPPPEIPWKEFCVFITESDVRNIPAILEGLKHDAHAMGQRALQAYREYFAPNVFLDRLLGMLVSNFDKYNYNSSALWWRAWRASGSREIRTICHQVYRALRPGDPAMV